LIPLSEPAPAKLNLGLEVLGRRDDGFHELRTILVPLEAHDLLQCSMVEDRDDVVLSVDGPWARGLPSDSGNLVVRAARAFFHAFPPKRACRFRLTKNLPHGAGLGGGSSDAAAALRLLARLTGRGTPRDLESLAAALGSDIPFFLRDGMCLAEGRGERLSDLGPPPAAVVVLLWPGFGSSTAQMYRRLTARGDGHRIEMLIRELRNGSDTWWNKTFNDFETLETPGQRRLRRLLEESGARAVRLAGSGSTVAGLFPPGTDPAIFEDSLGNMNVRPIITRIAARKELP